MMHCLPERIGNRTACRVCGRGLIVTNGRVPVRVCIPPPTDLPLDDEPGCRGCERGLSKRPALEAAVCIISHNYGRYLAQAIESVLSQTRRPAEVLIVDDASDDDTPDVARRYADQGVRYIRVEHRNSNLSRRSGLEATTAPVLCFLDADDLLPPDYLARGLPLFEDPHVGLVYSDVRMFGAEERTQVYPLYPGCNLQQRNFCHAGSLVRRSALELSRAFETRLAKENQDDWFLWRRIHADGWKLAKNPAVYRYRRHSQSQSFALKRDRTAWFDLAALAHEPVTIFIPFSGRLPLWEHMRVWLQAQTWPHAQTRLVFCDTSQTDWFARLLRRWLAFSDYQDVRYYRQDVGLPGLADADRHDQAIRQAVQRAMPLIYNRLAREATTEYVLIVEDDILPPVDAIARLLRGFDQLTASVSGAYRSRFHDGYVAWDIDRRIFTTPGTGLQTVGGNGFGCVLLRRSVSQDVVFQHADPTGDYDPNFYAWLRSTRFAAKLDWSVECEHREVPRDAEDHGPAELAGRVEPGHAGR